MFHCILFKVKNNSTKNNSTTAPIVIVIGRIIWQFLDTVYISMTKFNFLDLGYKLSTPFEQFGCIVSVTSTSCWIVFYVI